MLSEAAQTTVMRKGEADQMVGVASSVAIPSIQGEDAHWLLHT